MARQNNTTPDKEWKGVMIFEGDILRDNRGEDGEVIYASPQFVVYSANEIFLLAGGKVNVIQLEYTFIVGNIHEPETP